MAAAWDPTSVTAVTLSGGNLVATNTGTTSQDQGARVATVNGKTSGKYYFESTWTARTGGADHGVGVGTPTSTYIGMGFTGGVVGVEAYFLGSVYANGSQVYSSGGYTVGSVIGIAIDLDNRKAWFRLSPSGVWNNGGAADPVTNVGGFTIPAGTMVPFVTFGGTSGAANNVVTANFGDSAFVGAVPSGYIAGWTTAANYVDLAGNLGGISHYGRLKYGLGHYSRISALAPTFAADLSILGFSAVDLAGGLIPTVVLAADLDVHVDLIDLAGDLAPQIALEGSLSLDLPLTVLEGGLTPIVVLGASSFVSGPLWASGAPVVPPWAPSEPCPPSMWTPIEPCDPVEWEESELCNG